MKADANPPKPHCVALALTWDGARWPTRALEPKARAFLAGATRKTTVPSAARLAKYFERHQVKEIRICWVPRLKGGTNVLAQPFTTSSGKRIAFKVAKTIPFGDVLGVIYRRYDRA